MALPKPNTVRLNALTSSFGMLMAAVATKDTVLPVGMDLSLGSVATHLETHMGNVLHRLDELSHLYDVDQAAYVARPKIMATRPEKPDVQIEQFALALAKAATWMAIASSVANSAQLAAAANDRQRGVGGKTNVDAKADTANAGD